MKTIILSLFALTLSTTIYATHYQQKGNVADEQSKYIINDAMLMKAPLMHPKPFYEFYSDCSSLKNEESGLVKTGLAEYRGASGRYHKIADLFKTYENRAKRSGAMKIKSQHDDDVVCVLSSNGTEYTIDIYTGQDAIDFMSGE